MNTTRIPHLTLLVLYLQVRCLYLQVSSLYLLPCILLTCCHKFLSAVTNFKPWSGFKVWRVHAAGRVPFLPLFCKVFLYYNWTLSMVKYMIPINLVFLWVLDLQPSFSSSHWLRDPFTKIIIYITWSTLRFLLWHETLSPLTGILLPLAEWNGMARRTRPRTMFTTEPPMSKKWLMSHQSSGPRDWSMPGRGVCYL